MPISFLNNKFVIPVFGLLTTTLSAIYILKHYLFSEEKEDIVNEILFFCNRGINCRDHFRKEDEKKSCLLVDCSFKNLSRMLHYLNSAKESLDVCLYLITVKDLCKAIMKAHKRGVRVRIITDEDMANESGSQIRTFRNIGITVRHQRRSTTLMHHKFVVIDQKLVMTGSLNWTMQAICGNWDNLIITSQPQIIRGFINEFDRLWSDFK